MSNALILPPVSSTSAQKFAASNIQTYSKLDKPKKNSAHSYENPSVIRLALLVMVLALTFTFYFATRLPAGTWRKTKAVISDGIKELKMKPTPYNPDAPIVPSKFTAKLLRDRERAASTRASATAPVPESRFDHLVIAVKTGQDVAAERVPIQLVSFLKDVKNLMVIGDAANVVVGANTEMHDVFSDLYENVTATRNSDFYDQINDAEGTGLIKGPNGDLIPDESSAGWRSDAHKNLPGFRLMWQRFPNAEWFVMIDDDSYLFMDNLAFELKKHNAEQPFYFGNANMFVGCDGVNRLGDGPNFAHGGSGIVISRGAMKKMMSDGIVENCIQKYRDCWAGDVRTALCLRDAQVLLQGYWGFSGSPPSKEFWYPRDACMLPITFHHLRIKQMQKLADIERLAHKKHKNGLVPISEIFHYWKPRTTNWDMETNADRHGSDFSHVYTSDANECKSKCAENKSCRAFTFKNGECWLKDEMPPSTTSDGSSSGIMEHNYVCDKF